MSLKPLALGVLLGAAPVLACARILPPPGGKSERQPPQLVAIRPDSLKVYPGFKGDVEFQFDEVVSEGSAPNIGLGTGDLEKLIVLSPSRNVPSVSWKRQRITVHPKEGWKPNRVYRVELRPGITDLLRNRSDTNVIITFSTGAPLPTDTLRGIVLDWLNRKPAPAALLEFVLQPDTLIYRAVADSSGRFAIGPLPRGTYVAYGVIDQNRNGRREGREAFDSLELQPARDSVGALWAFVHDTAGPRTAVVQPNDSMSATLTFPVPLDPYQRFDSLVARLRLLPDSSPVKVASLLPKPADDSIHGRRAEVADTALEAEFPRQPDSAAARPPVRPPPARPPAQRPTPPADTSSISALLATRPPLTDKLVLRTAEPLKPNTSYTLEIDNVRNASGVPGNVRTGFKTAKPAPLRPDSTARVGPDSTVRDSTAAPPQP